MPLGLVPWSVALWAGMVAGSFGALYVGLSPGELVQASWWVAGGVAVAGCYSAVAGCYSVAGAVVVVGSLVGLLDAGFVADLVVELAVWLVVLQPDVVQLVSALVDCYWDRASIRVLAWLYRPLQQIRHRESDYSEARKYRDRPHLQVLVGLSVQC